MSELIWTFVDKMSELIWISAKWCNRAIKNSTYVRRMRMYEDGERNVRSCIAFARKEAREEVEAKAAQQIAKIKEEAEQKAAETNRLHAKKMKELGVEYQVISNIIGLSLDEIEAL